MVNQRCPRCRAEVSGDAPEGLCPACLFRQAIDSGGESPAPAEPHRSPFPPFVPPTPAELARHFPHLEILALLGQGGMGAVYKARQTKLDRLVALKVLPPEVARDPAFAERFTREARSLARLNHPHIVTIFDFGESDGLFYFTMEHVDGQNVRELLQAGELSAAQALRIVPQVCDALQYAHDEGVVHRDIKPENILLDRRGRVKIADFGLAKIVGLPPAYRALTASREVMGTLYYMAPEQTTGSRAVDHRADIYSLGVVFYEMLTGELPLGRFAPPSHKARIDPRLDAVVLRALIREPEQRYQDAAELKKDVEAATAGPPPTEVPFVPAAAARGVGGSWPTVRFKIPMITWWGAEARGEIYRDSEALIIDWRRTLDPFKWDRKQVRLPFREIVSLSCQNEDWIEMPGVPKWMREKKGATEIVIKAVRPSALDHLPVGSAGAGRLLVHRKDRQAARELVASVVQPPPAPAGPARPGAAGPAAPAPVSERVRALLPAAIGLLVAAAAVLLWSVVETVTLSREAYLSGAFTFQQGLHLARIVAAQVGVGLIIPGAILMLCRRHYPFAVVSAAIAVFPMALASQWLCVPFGIWALVVLSQREVRAAFYPGRRGPTPTVLVPPPSPPPPPPPPPVGGGLRSFARSIGRYFLTGFSGRAEPPPEPEKNAGAANGAARGPGR
jgi:tRNA A-37 threonylcarbamoyl transferase component Bud32